jgi:GNAT superfamily N-acetyltransferase
MARNAFSIRAPQEIEIPVVQELFREYARELELDLSYQGFEAELSSLPGEYASPRGALFLAISAAGMPVGCIAMRSLTEAGSCELKRMYVRASSRRRGIGHALAKAAIRAAERAGYFRMYLDTLPTLTPALALYERLGFTRTAAYYDTPIIDTIFMRKDLQQK